MGLGASGKSSIQSIVFKGRLPEEVMDYKATINYTRSTKNIIDSSFQIFDCGGQESFISAFIGDQAEFIFSDVSILVWVVDISDFDQVSTSKFYFNHAITSLYEYSPEGVVFCLFHKRDLLAPDKLDETFQTIKQYFEIDYPIKIHYRTSSILDRSIYQVIGEMLQSLILKSLKARTVSEAIQDFLSQHPELVAITLCNEEGVPIFEEGEQTNDIFFPSNLALTNYEKVKREFTTLKNFKSIMELNDRILLFQRLKKDLLFTGIAEKIGPTQYTLVTMDKIITIINKLI